MLIVPDYILLSVFHYHSAMRSELYTGFFSEHYQHNNNAPLRFKFAHYYTYPSNNRAYRRQSVETNRDSRQHDEFYV